METNNSVPILEILRGDNYAIWSVRMKTYLLSRDLWEVIGGPAECSSLDVDEPKLDAKEAYKIWKKKNAIALYSIQNSCESKVLSHILEITTAENAWNRFAQIYQAKKEEKKKVEEKKLEAKKEEKKIEAKKEEKKVEAEKEEKKVEAKKEEKQGSEPAKKDDEYLQFQPFIHAINRGNLEGMMDFINLHPDAKNAKILANGSTPLHVACTAGQVKIVERLVELLSAEDLEMKDNSGFTALILVAMNGVIKMAECLIKKNKNLVGIATNNGRIPVAMASIRRHQDMTRYLYSVTPLELLVPEKGTNGSMLLVCCILSKVLDVAVDLIGRCPKLTTVKNGGNSYPIFALARMASIFPRGSDLSFWRRWIYSCMHVQLHPFSAESRIDIPEDVSSERKNIIIQAFGKVRQWGSTITGISEMKKLYNMKLIHLQALEILRHMCEEVSTLQISQVDPTGVKSAFFRAVQYGTVEFVVEMAKANLQLLYLKDKNSRGIFQVAVEYRQEKIFSLFYGLDARRESLVTSIDSKNNTISHLAGLLAPTAQLARISGAPLQMQRELQWYKEVESIVGSMHEGYFNDDNEIPSVVFTKNHADLLKKGEEYMKQTAESSTVVGALIITIMFAAAFTSPGGNDQNTGYPMFLHKKAFTTFIISDAISLFFSSTSVLMFLSILTSRYAEEDFLKSLPTKLIIGLSTLFISIASMMVAFCAALLLMLKAKLGIVIPLTLLACFPITFFILLQFPLLREIFMSTYGPSIFDRKMKPWL